MNYLSVLLILTSILLSNQSDINLAFANNPKNISLTIYNQNIAMVSEERSADIQKTGNIKLMYSGIPTNIDTSSIVVSFTPKAKLFSQNYSFNTISYNSLLNYHLGKTIHYTEKSDSVEILEGTLISLAPILIREKNYGAIYKPYQLFFPDIPKDMAVKPSLFWNIQTTNHILDINLRYLTRGISWSSDYNINMIDNERLNINGWITIDNNSGATYNNANINVVAGDLNIANRDKISLMSYKKRSLKSMPNIKSESLLGYYLYKIPFKETIKDKEKKQILFIEKEGIKYNKYSINNEEFHFYNFGERELSFTQIIKFKNSINNRLGVPLPKGDVRVYKKDNSNQVHFVGSMNIKNTPKEESVEIAIGKHFDIVGKETIKEYRETSKERFVKYSINVKNRGNQNEIIKIKKSIPINRGTLIIKDSCANNCSKKSINAFTTMYTLSLEPNEEYNIDISYNNTNI